MWINTIIYSNLFPLLISILFLVLIIYNPIFNKKQEKLFFIAGILNVIMLISISIDYFIYANQITSFWILRRFTSFLNFAVSPAIPLLLYNITSEKKLRFKTYIPILFNVLICIISFFNGCVFFITTTNNYARGTLFFIPFVITILYMFLLILQIRNHRMKSLYMERIFLILVIVFLCTGMILEVAYHFFFLSWVSSALSLPLYYLLINIDHAILDPLTGIFNRLMYEKDIARINGKKPCIITLLDINDFKSINDNYGHDVGDKYLKNFANALSQHVNTSTSIYRIGGDEFIIIFKKIDMTKAMDILHNIRIKCEQDDIRFSYGIDKYTPDQNISTFLNQIDQKMYENKKLTKKGQR